MERTGDASGSGVGTTGTGYYPRQIPFAGLVQSSLKLNQVLNEIITWGCWGC